MYSKVSSDWLPNYIKATRPVLEVLKMAGYFPDSPRTPSFGTYSVPVFRLLLHDDYLYCNKICIVTM